MNEAALPQSTVHIAQADPDGILLVIHAGAGNRGKKDTPERRAQVEQDLNRALEAGYALLEQGAPAEDAVCAAIRVMEDAPEFNAGRGAALTSEGIVSMDSCLMADASMASSRTSLSSGASPDSLWIYRLLFPLMGGKFTTARASGFGLASGLKENKSKSSCICPPGNPEPL